MIIVKEDPPTYHSAFENDGKVYINTLSTDVRICKSLLKSLQCIQIIRKKKEKTVEIQELWCHLKFYKSIIISNFISYRKIEGKKSYTFFSKCYLCQTIFTKTPMCLKKDEKHMTIQKNSNLFFINPKP